VTEAERQRLGSLGAFGDEVPVGLTKDEGMRAGGGIFPAGVDPL